MFGRRRRPQVVARPEKEVLRLSRPQRSEDEQAAQVEKIAQVDE
jgi:hypothetical protein